MNDKPNYDENKEGEINTECVRAGIEKGTDVIRDNEGGRECSLDQRRHESWRTSSQGAHWRSL